MFIVNDNLFKLVDISGIMLETWIRTNKPEIDRNQIKRDLVKKLTLPNYQFKNPFKHYDEIKGYSTYNEITVEDNYKDQNSEYQTTIKINSSFSIPENVPKKTKLTPSKRITAFLEKMEFKKQEEN